MFQARNPSVSGISGKNRIEQGTSGNHLDITPRLSGVAELTWRSSALPNLPKTNSLRLAPSQQGHFDSSRRRFHPSLLLIRHGAFFRILVLHDLKF